MRISTKRSNLPEGKFLGSKVRCLGVIVPVLFLLMNFQTVWSQTFDPLHLVESVDQLTWSPTTGDGVSGFQYCLDPAVTYYYLNTAASTATDIDLVSGMYGFNVTSTPAGWLSFWASKGVDGTPTGGWEDYMWPIINGTAPIFYLKVDALGDFSLIDGLQYTASGGLLEEPLRINGDYLPGDYTYTGDIVGVNTVTNTVSFNATVNQIPATPEFTTLELVESTDMSTWTSTSGDYINGFTYCLEPASQYFLNIGSGSATNVDLSEGMYGFNVTTYPAGWFAYWAGLGVDGTPTGSWQDYMWPIINGTSPIFYLKVDALGNMSLVDGLQYTYASNETYLTINGNYLAGQYTYTGTIDAGCGSTNTISINATVGQVPFLSFGFDDMEAAIGNTYTYCFNQSFKVDIDSYYGGVAPYIIDYTVTGPTSWSNSLSVVAGTELFNGTLDAGVYNVAVTSLVDANGCEASPASLALLSTTVTILDQPYVNSVDVSSPILCNGGSTGVVITASGATPISYNFDGGVNDVGIFSAVTAGSYAWSVSDANGCATVTGIFDVTEPTALTAVASTTGDILCYGGTTDVTLIASGGTAPYIYTLDGGSNFTDITFGTHSWSVTDDNGCMVSGIIEILQPDQLGLSWNVSDFNGYGVHCYGDTDGSIDLTITGGTTPYTYSWSTTNGSGLVSGDQNQSGLGAGTYNVTVTDDNGCMASQTIYVNTPPAMSISLAASNYNGYEVSIYGGSNGWINATVGGGAGGYSYSWSNGAITEDISLLPAGPYTLIATDLNSCSITDGEILTEPAELLIGVVAVNNVTCNGTSTGSIDLTITGGVAPYFYLWANTTGYLPIFQADANNLPAGDYSFTVTDINGAVATFGPQTITQPIAMSAELIKNDVVCNGDSDGDLTATVMGGVSPYTFVWYRQGNPNDSLFVEPGWSTSYFDGLSPDNYCVAIQDQNGCNIARCEIIEEPTALLAWQDSISNYNGYNVSCFGEHDGWISISVSGGIPPYDYAWGNNYQTDQDGTNLWAGPWGVWVEDDNGCDFVIQWILTQPPAIIANAYVTTDVTCNGGNDGSASAVVTGGTGPVSIEWFKGLTSVGTGASVNNLDAGIYNIEVTDPNTYCGAYNSDSVSVENFPSSWVMPPNSSDSHTIYIPTANVSVAGGPAQNGDIIGVFFDGGAGCAGYSVINGTETIVAAWIDDPTTGVKDGMSFGEAFTWKIFRPFVGEFSVPAPTYAIVPPFSPGNYSGLQSQITSLAGIGSLPLSVTYIEITEPTVLNFSSTEVIENVSCFGFNDGSIDITVGGGTPSYTYNWTTSNGSGLVAGDQDQSGLTAGTYEVGVTDAHGCFITATYTITQPDELELVMDQVLNNLCYNSNDGSIQVTVSGGSTPYTYSWSNGSIDEDIFGIADGTYTLNVVDAHMCAISGSWSVTEPDTLEITSYSVVDVNCFGDSNGSINVVFQGGTSPYTYLWDNGAATQNISGLLNGTYVLTITDANSCTVSGTYIVASPPVLESTAFTASDFNGWNVSCNGDHNGSINLEMTGGILPYTYLWSNSEITQDISDLGAGAYSVLVTDANGCTFTASMTLSQPDLFEVVSVTGSDFNGFSVSCFGSDNGTIDLELTGGVINYTYNWTTTDGSGLVAGDEDQSGLTAGTYDVEVTDLNGCTVTSTITLTEPTNLDWLTNTISDFNGYGVSCFGSSNGTIDINHSGGVSPYTYSWTTADGSGLSASADDQANLTAGTYSVTVTDANGCFITASFIITEPDQLYINATSTNVSCYGGNDGTATANVVSGGVGLFGFDWGSFGNTQTISGLAAGVYGVTITDENGCVSNNGQSNVLPASWTFFNTGFNHAINVLDVNTSVTFGGSTLVPGDYIGVFFDSLGVLYCAGYTEYTTISANLTVIAWANDIVTTEKDGFDSGDTFFWKIWRPFVGELDAIPTYSNDPIYTEMGTYLNNGQSGLTSLVNNDNLGVIDVSYVEVTQPELLEVTLSAGLIQCTDGITDITAVVTGGTPSYTYSWASGTNVLAGVTAGTYELMITDAMGCTTPTATITISNPSILHVTDIFTTDAICFGDNTATAVVNVGGGYPPYTQDWGSYDPMSLYAGTYYVTVTDAQGCTITPSVTVGEATALLASGVSTMPSCNGGYDGTIDLTVTNGTYPYTYIWSTFDIDEDINNLYAGDYFVTVTDFNGCTTTASVTVTEPTAVTVTGVVFEYAGGNNVSCYGESDGSINITADGGTPPYSYDWTFTTDEDPSGLSVGTYTVIVSDDNGCTVAESFTLTGPTPLIATATITSQYEIPAGSGNFYSTSCNGMDGSVGLAVYGGTAPFTYTWSYGYTTSSLSGIPAGTYAVTVIDANGCETISNSVTLNTPGPQNVVAVSASDFNGYDIRCNGGVGSINVTWDQGVGPFDIYWSQFPGSYTLDTMTQTFTQWNTFPAGTYWVAIYDSNGCGQLSNMITIDQPDPINPQPGLFDVSCFGGADGYIDLTQTTGGVPYTTGSPYLFQWDGIGNFLPTPTLTGLSAGDNPYVVVWDANNCSEGFQYEVIQPDSLVIDSINVIDALCFGDSTGQIIPHIHPYAGTPPYEYSIDGSIYVTALDNISAGTYTVYVRDFNGCISTGTAVIGQPTELLASGIASDATCFGLSDGSIVLQVAGGTPPYTYVWSNSVITVSNPDIPAGAYDVDVIDANGCTKQLSFTIGQPDELLLSASSVPTTCFGYSDGSLDLSVSGGTISYDYEWAGGELTEDISGQMAGDYTVTVTDAHGCEAFGAYTIMDAPAINIVETIVTVSCNGLSDGSISVDVSGGTGIGTYSYIWSVSGASETISGLAVGSYSLTVTDGNNCTASATYSVGQPDVLAVSFNVVDVICNGGDNGSVEAIVSGGTSPYNYSWSNGVVGIGLNTIGTLTSDSYILVVTDTYGCTVTGNDYVSEPSAINLSFTNTNVSCNNSSDGTIYVEVDSLSGTSGSTYTYLWDYNSLTTQNLSGLDAGTYTVEVTESTGCVVTASTTVTQPDPLSVTLTPTNVVCFGDANGMVEANTIGGTTPYTYVWSVPGNTNLIDGLLPDTYSLTVTDANGCFVSSSAIVEEAAPLGLTLIPTNVNCNLDQDGSINLTVVGGATPFQYAWSDINHTATEDISGLGADTYTVTVTDANGCIGIASAIVNVTYPFVIVSDIVTNVSCNEANDPVGAPGSVSQNGAIFVQMAQGHKNFVWTNISGTVIDTTQNATSSSITNVPAGLYHLAISAFGGVPSCVMYVDFVVNEPDVLDFTTTISDASCYKFNDGSIIVGVSGGTQPWTYQWTNGANIVGTDDSLMNRKAGTYKIVVTDNHGCTSQEINQITQPSLLTSAINTSDVTCFGFNNGSLFVNVNGGTSPYTYNWSGTLTGNNPVNLGAGTYTVQISDINGCSTSNSATIGEPSVLSVVAIGTDLTCNGSGDGSAYASVTGGTFPYTFLWNDTPSTTNDYIQNVDAGNYIVTVTDANLCWTSDDVTLIEPDALTLTFDTSHLGTLVFLEAIVGGGTPVYTYNWSTGGTDYSTLVIPGNTYEVTVTDDNGCDIVGYYTVPPVAPSIAGSDIDDENPVANSEVKELNVTVYPNPSADGRFFVDLGQISTADAQLEIVDGFGKVIQKIIVPGQSANQVELQLQVAKGVYFLKITTKENGSITKSLVITE